MVREAGLTRPRVAQVINSLSGGGAENLVANLAPRLVRRGVAVDVITLYPFAQRGLVATLGSSGARLIELRSRRRFDPRLAVALRRTLASGGYSTVHAHLFPALYWTALAAPRHLTRVFTEHCSTNRRRRAGYRHLERALYQRYDHVVSVSQRVHDELVAWAPEVRARARVIPVGIDVPRFQGAVAADRRALGIPSEVPLAITVARIERPQKDHWTLVHALVRIPDLHLAVVGSGPDEGALRRRVAELGVAGRVHFLGVRDDVPALLKAADLFVLSTRHEGFPLALVEAMASGLAVVTSDFDGVDEVVRHQATGWVFGREDVDGLAAALHRLVHDADLRTHLARHGQRVGLRFDLERVVDALLPLYR